MDASINPFCRRIAVLRGVGSGITRFAHEPPPKLRFRNFAYLTDMSRLLRAVRLALHPAKYISGGIL